MTGIASVSGRFPQISEISFIANIYRTRPIVADDTCFRCFILLYRTAEGFSFTSLQRQFAARGSSFQLRQLFYFRELAVSALRRQRRFLFFCG